MNKLFLASIIIGSMVFFSACAGTETVNNLAADSSQVILPDTLINMTTASDTLERFVGEPGLLKMVRENYLDVMAGETSFLIIPFVVEPSCGLVSFEAVDSQLRIFRSGIDSPGYWLLKGKNETYSSKIAKNFPDDSEIAPPKRPLEDYGLFQSSTLIFELRNNSEIVRWISIDR